MTKLCRVLVADDNPVVREVYRMSLTRHDNYEVVDEARNGREAVEAYEGLGPDVVLMDLQMPGVSGVDAMREVNRKHHGVYIVALTTFGTQEYIISALRAGASGCLMKDCSRPALLTGIQQVHDGEMPLAPGVRQELVADLLTGHPKVLTDETAAAGFAPHERELLIWLGRGMTNAQTAAEMFISEGSVKQYLSHTGDKMELKSHTQILVRAIQLGPIDPTLMTPGAS